MSRHDHETIHQDNLNQPIPRRHGRRRWVCPFSPTGVPPIVPNKVDRNFILSLPAVDGAFAPHFGSTERAWPTACPPAHHVLNRGDGEILGFADITSLILVAIPEEAPDNGHRRRCHVSEASFAGDRVSDGTE